MKKFGSIAVIAIVGMLLASTADARPQYAKAVGAKYPAAMDALKAAKCGACHGNGGKNKKVVSAYAKEIKAALGAKNVKDADKIMEALTKAGAKTNDDGKTYDSILEGGKLPAPAP